MNISEWFKSSINILLIGILGLSALLPSCSEKVTVEEQNLTEGWQIISSKEITEDGKAVSTTGRSTANWINTKVPTTVLAALIEAGIYKDVFYGDNLAKIPTQPFEIPWWYRKEFTIKNFNSKSEELRLLIDGINYRANIWLNGRQIASQDTLYGAFRQFEIDITQYVQADNVLAFEIIPPKPRDFYMGFVDWAPTPPDKYMGIYREVRLKRTGKVAIDHPFVKTDVNTKTLNGARLSVSAELSNFSSDEKTVSVTGKIEEIQFKKDFVLGPNERKTVLFTPKDVPQLDMKNPRLWWPNGLGAPNMYSLDLRVIENGSIKDQQIVNFGIRTIETYLNESGVRGYKVNGRKVMQKSGGWVDDLFLRYMPEKDAAQIRYVKEMNMNALRFEGVWGNNHHIYDLCDRNGILLMVGWSCQWEWPDYLGLPLVVPEDYDESMTIAESTEMSGVKLTSKEEDLLNEYLKHQVKWLRNHPSIYCWAVGSDAMPKPRLESLYRETLDQYDETRSLLISAGEFESEISGPSGMKMLGPYEYVPPVYWFEDKKWGGAYGFNSETGPGPQIPPIESIKKMIPEAHLWPPANKMWNYHSGRKDFNSVKVYLKALNNRYGEPKDLEELALKAQLMNYEAIRPMFEAHVINRPTTTGVVQWMLNSPWPEMYWQLYDYYLMPTGAYFGTQKSGQPSTLIYNYDDNNVYASNDAPNAIKDHKALITIYDINSNTMLNEEIAVNLSSDETIKLTDLPPLKDAGKVCFLDLQLVNGSSETVSDNFYWLSTKKDLLDWPNTVWYYTPQKQYADFTAVNSMDKVDISVEKEIVRRGEEWELHVTVTNPSDKLVFFVELMATKKSDGSSILPVFWSDNYISLAPGKSKTLNLKFYQKDLGNDEPVLKIQGMNLKKDLVI
ncbi:MAG: glycoside hydrolase family 2 [Cytophagales bacterium]|nr:glycoside hydrolase family 2 [Cytophagales bacterium]